jgi:alkylated DNA repair dioxygenase AlkB
VAAPHLAWQCSLFGDTAPSVDGAFHGVTRYRLDERSWVDHQPGWLSGADEVFAALVEHAGWAQLTRPMYGEKVLQPRLTARWHGDAALVERLPVLDDMRALLSARYRREFDSGGLNLYRDGRDSVAWHGDRIPKELEEPVVAIVSVGEPRRFLLRPRGGGPSRRFQLGSGDLLVTGGRCQREWQHSVPKVATAGPRISITFRHST